MEPHCLSSVVTGFPCTPYGPLCMLYEAKALSTTIWLKKGKTDWPHFLFSAVGAYDHKLLSTNSIILCTQPNDCFFFKLPYINQYSYTFASDIACTVRLVVPVFMNKMSSERSNAIEVEEALQHLSSHMSHVYCVYSSREVVVKTW